MARNSSSSLAKESEGGKDREASQCDQEDLLGLVGPMSVNAKIARWRKAQRSTGFTTVPNGTQQGGIIRNAPGSESKRRERQRKNGNGKEV